MNNNAITGFFLYATLYSMIVLFTAFIIMTFTLPRIWNQKAAKNGLIVLRRLLLVTGGSIWLLTLISLIILGSRFFIPTELVRPATYILLMAFATIVLINAISKHFIYTLNYSDKSIEDHRRFAKYEKREKTKKGVKK